MLSRTRLRRDPGNSVVTGEKLTKSTVWPLRKQPVSLVKCRGDVVSINHFEIGHAPARTVDIAKVRHWPSSLAAGAGLQPRHQYLSFSCGE